MTLSATRTEDGSMRLDCRAQHDAEATSAIAVRECILIGRGNAERYCRVVPETSAPAHHHGVAGHDDHHHEVQDVAPGIVTIQGAQPGDYLAWVRLSDGTNEWVHVDTVTLPRVKTRRPWWETAHKH